MQHRTYSPADRPMVEVLVEGQWRPGDLRMWVQNDDGQWFGQVQWQPAGNTSHTIDTFPADRIRPDVTDYTQGRG